MFHNERLIYLSLNSSIKIHTIVRVRKKEKHDFEQKSKKKDSNITINNTMRRLSKIKMGNLNFH